MEDATPRIPLGCVPCLSAAAPRVRWRWSAHFEPRGSRARLAPTHLWNADLLEIWGTGSLASPAAIRGRSLLSADNRSGASPEARARSDCRDHGRAVLEGEIPDGGAGRFLSCRAKRRAAAVTRAQAVSTTPGRRMTQRMNGLSDSKRRSSKGRSGPGTGACARRHYTGAPEVCQGCSRRRSWLRLRRSNRGARKPWKYQPCRR